MATTIAPAKTAVSPCTAILLINGLWLETAALAEDPPFVSALARGLRRFQQLLKTQSIDLSAVKTSRAEAKLARQLKNQFV